VAPPRRHRDISIQSLREPQVALALKDQWWALEKVNALALDQGSLRPLTAHVAFADQVLQEMAA